MKKRPLLVMVNMHAESCGTPPAFLQNAPGVYHGYFETTHGEQWVFRYYQGTDRAELHGGGAGWQRMFEVIDGKVSELVLQDNELRWLEACWAAATQKSRRDA
jgi:hypothetical protein